MCQSINQHDNLAEICVISLLNLKMWKSQSKGIHPVQIDPLTFSLCADFDQMTQFNLFNSILLSIKISDKNKWEWNNSTNNKNALKTVSIINNGDNVFVNSSFYRDMINGFIITFHKEKEIACKIKCSNVMVLCVLCCYLLLSKKEKPAIRIDMIILFILCAVEFGYNWKELIKRSILWICEPNEYELNVHGVNKW